ncbi:hypothetical protein [Limnoglobus roseus]|uniref:Tetratricopeptide repeat protein n=1 Tax=Limnoglobus roseus TaxID=2598579 RepID=A0A5C1A5Z3_9BACT|nr:hypothetical protein [Limnoglobus roseus]QEL13252.1 tetratricopeptide repeat protein [Limnoglobus roseus]
MTAPALTPGPTLRHTLILFALAGLAAYFNSFQGAFVLDDLAMIVDPNLGKPLQGRLAGRPVVSLTFTLNYWLDGLNTRGYHLANLLVHIAAAVVLFDLVRRTLLLPRFGTQYTASANWLALVVGLLWLVHPLNTQSVTYMVQRCESLMGLFFLLALWAYLRGVTADEPSWRWYALGGVACVLASGCKELTFAVPVLAAVYDRTFLARSWREVWGRWKPLAILCIGPVLGIALVLARGFLTDKGGTVGFGVPRFTPVSYALTQTEVVPYYLWLSVWPKNLCIDYIDWPIPTFADAVPYLFVVSLALAATAWGVVRHAAWGFLLAWFFVILAPTSSVIPIQDPAFEHRLYLPLIAVVVAVVVAGWSLLRLLPPAVRGPLAVVAVVGLTAALAGRTILRNEDYTSPAALALDVITQRPENARSRMAYAAFLLRTGHPDDALGQMLVAAKHPGLIADWVVLGNCYEELGRGAEAEKFLRDLVTAKPTDGRRNSALANVLLQNGKPAEAEEFARAAIPSLNDIHGRVLLASCLDEQGRTAEADSVFAEARRIAPEGYRHSLGTSARRTTLDPTATKGHLRQAYLDARAAVRLNDRDDWEEWDTLAICYARGGQFAEAVKAEERAIQAAGSRSEYERHWLAGRLVLFRAGKPYLQPGG